MFYPWKLRTYYVQTTGIPCSVIVSCPLFLSMLHTGKSKEQNVFGGDHSRARYQRSTSSYSALALCTCTVYCNCTRWYAQNLPMLLREKCIAKKFLLEGGGEANMWLRRVRRPCWIFALFKGIAILTVHPAPAISYSYDTIMTARLIHDTSHPRNL